MDYFPDASMDMSQIMRMAQSPAGKKLIAMLQNNQSEELKQAMNLAAEGDYSLAKKEIEKFLSTPEANSLIQQLRGK